MAAIQRQSRFFRDFDATLPHNRVVSEKCVEGAIFYFLMSR
jgi:hypothetical protein